MFLPVAEGNLEFARLAAAEAIDAYRAETHSDLIIVAKIIAFGLATLCSLSLSMTDDLPVPQILRLRANANATDRSEHRNRLALKQDRPQLQPTLLQPNPPQTTPPPEPAIDHAALAAAAADMQQRTADHLARVSSSPATSGGEARYQAVWAASAATVAAETAAALSDMPADERRSAELWIGALNETAASLMAGDVPPRLRPGDLGAIMRGA